ncbi:MAG: hypothetical protein P8J51_00400 [Dehalococcoidia bacterium]|nr:hypothetical protein [Dehalococcoidia bacterium]
MKIKKIILVSITWFIIVAIFFNIENDQKLNQEIDFVSSENTEHINSTENRNYYMGFNVDTSNNLEEHRNNLINALELGDIVMTIHYPSWEKFINKNSSFYNSKNINKIILEHEIIQQSKKKSLLVFNIFDRENKNKLANYPYNNKDLSKNPNEKTIEGETYNALIEEIIFLTSVYKPDYFALGLEINITYEKNPAIFQEYLDLYFEAYDKIKKMNNQIKIFPIFQYERLLGFSASQPSQIPRWEIVDMFNNKMDYFAISSTPSKFTLTGRNLPDNYYRQLSSITNIPIIFTGIGFEGSAKSESSAPTIEEQYNFINKLFQDSDIIKYEAILWMQLKDFFDKKNKTIYEYGLYEQDKSKKKTFHLWLKNLNNKKK